MRISDSDMDDATASFLSKNGYETLEQVSRQTYSRISGLNGMSGSDMDDIERALATRGLKLRDRPKERSEFYQQIGVYP